MLIKNNLNKSVLLLFALFAFVNIAKSEGDFESNFIGFSALRYGLHSENSEADKDGQTKNTFQSYSTNLLYAARYGDNIKAMIDLEVYGHLFTSSGMGSINLHQSWIDYSFSKELSVRFGRFISPFTNFNTIHSRQPLFNFISRPFAYEESDYPTTGFNSVRWEMANFSIGGTIGDNLKLDYTAFFGNTERTNPFGSDLNTGKRVGVRLNVHDDNFRFGVTSVFGDYNPYDSNGTVSVNSQKSIMRLAADFRVDVSDFFIEGEFIHASGKYEAIGDYKTSLDDSKTEENIAYGIIGYKITDKLIAYGAFDYARSSDKLTSDGNRFDTGLTRKRGGLNYILNEKVILKAEYNMTDGNGKAETDPNFYKAWNSLLFSTVFTF